MRRQAGLHPGSDLKFCYELGLSINSSFTARWYKTFFSCADKIRAACFAQGGAGFAVEGGVVAEEQCALQGFVAVAARHVDGFVGEGIEAGVEHGGGQRERGGVEVLYLLRGDVRAGAGIRPAPPYL